MLYRFVSIDAEGNRIRSDPIYLDTNNTDRYFRYSFSHRIIEDQDRLPRTTTELKVVDCVVGDVGQELCSDPSMLDGKFLEGDFVKPKYQYLQLKVTKCVGTDCASVEEINAILDSGEAQIQVQLKTQNFNPDKYHLTGNGVVDNKMNWRLWGMTGAELKYDMYLQPRRIEEDERYAGSPPLPGTVTNILGFNRMESVIQPRPDDFFEVGSWFFRLSDSVQLENVAYWSSSILDLFGLWGAMASFLTSLSFGFVAFQYNRWMFNRHFLTASSESRKVAESKAKTAMNLITKKDKRSVQLYKAIRSQHDVLIQEPDVRLFDAHHFDDVGRVIVTSEELKYPSTAFGHVRKYAIREHMVQYRAARTISRWYVKILLKRGKIESAKRRLLLGQTLMGNSMLNVTGGNLRKANRLSSISVRVSQDARSTFILPEVFDEDQQDSTTEERDIDCMEAGIEESVPSGSYPPPDESFTSSVLELGACEKVEELA